MLREGRHTTDPREDTGIKGDTRITEEPDILYPEMKPSDPSMQLILAKVTLKPNKTVDEIDLSERTHAGIVSGDLETNSIAFSLPVTQTNWPRIKGVVDSGMTGIEISHKTAINGDLSVTGKVAGRDVSVDGAKLDNHVGNKSNPHSTTAAHVGAPISIDGVKNPGGNIDLIKKDSITIRPNDINNQITIGEDHSGLRTNPHGVTAAHVGAPISIDGVKNPGGNIDLIKKDSITIRPNDINNQITIGEDHSGLRTNPHGVTAAQVGAMLQNDYLKRKSINIIFNHNQADGATRTANIGFVPKLGIVTGGYSIYLGLIRYGGATSGWWGHGSMCPSNFITKYSDTNVRIYCGNAVPYIFYSYAYYKTASMAKARRETLSVGVSVSNEGMMTATLNRSKKDGEDSLESFIIYLSLLWIG